MFVGMWIWVSRAQCIDRFIASLKNSQYVSLQTSVAPLQIAIGNTTSVTDKQLKTASTCSVLGELFNLEFSVTMMYLFNAYDYSRPLIHFYYYTHKIYYSSYHQ